MNDSDNSTLAQPDLSVVRVRHALKFRMLQVRRVKAVTPRMVCVTLAGDDLDGFLSASFDDHIKVFFRSRVN